MDENLINDLAMFKNFTIQDSLRGAATYVTRDFTSCFRVDVVHVPLLEDRRERRGGGRKREREREKNTRNYFQSIVHGS